jgi:hypothetical protein
MKADVLLNDLGRVMNRVEAVILLDEDKVRGPKAVGACRRLEDGGLCLIQAALQPHAQVAADVVVMSLRPR